jgi:hypothetical protein
MLDTEDLMSTWTKQKPSQPGWYWMLDPSRELPLPTIVQIVFDRESQRWLALIPASHYPQTSGMALDLHNLEAIWAGPLQIPSLLGGENQKETSAIGAELGDGKNMAA